MISGAPQQKIKKLVDKKKRHFSMIQNVSFLLGVTVLIFHICLFCSDAPNLPVILQPSKHVMDLNKYK